jgi:hypothetical protein
MRASAWTSLAAAGVVLTACARPAPPPAPPPPPPPTTGETAYDLSGQSASCAAPEILTVADGASFDLKMALSNDGGWCGLRMSRNGKPLAAGLLPTMPLHGIVFIHRVVNFTRIDYTPTRGFTGVDVFQVKLLPGYMPVKVTVTVSPGSAAPASASATAPNPSTKP